MYTQQVATSGSTQPAAEQHVSFCLAHCCVHVLSLLAGSSSAAGSDVIKTIRDSKTDFSVMVYIINAGCDYQFWQVRLRQPTHSKACSAASALTCSSRCETSQQHATGLGTQQRSTCVMHLQPCMHMVCAYGFLRARQHVLCSCLLLGGHHPTQQLLRPLLPHPQVRMTSASPCFTNGGSGGGGVPGSKARVMQRLQQLGWQDIMQVRLAHGSTVCVWLRMQRCSNHLLSAAMSLVYHCHAKQLRPPAVHSAPTFELPCNMFLQLPACLQEVEATDESAIYERAMWDRLPLPAWSAAGGHVVLLGDAAHAMYSGPGQGARTAFEDAHQMFLAIKQHWPNPAAIAAQYEVCASGG